jgi:two-component system chemotaxis sensor kinase CheA
MTNMNSPHSKAVQDFIAEAEEITEQIGSELADLADMAERNELNPAVLNSIFRGAHSLKGLAGMFGFTDVAELAHNLENLLDRLRLGKLNFARPLMAVLFETHELLRALVRRLASGNETDLKDEISACVARIAACLVPPEKQPDVIPFNVRCLPDHMRGVLTEYEAYRLKDNLDRGRRLFCIHTTLPLASFDTELSEMTETLTNNGEVVSTLPSVGGNLDTHIDFEILFCSICSLQELKSIVERDTVTVTQIDIDGAALPSGEQPVRSVSATGTDMPGMAPNLVPDMLRITTEVMAPSVRLPLQDDASLSAKSMSRTVRVDIGKLDELMNIVGELALANSAIAGVTARMQSEGYSRLAIELGKAAKGLERKLSELQKGVMEIRMIPIGQLYEKMSRIVRKISREQGKRVELKFFGADTELDKLIVEDISDPMMHIVRNAIDHGIESGDIRKLRGKSETGTIRISSFQKGNRVVIEIDDDGAGIDIEKIKSKALQQGLISDVRTLSDRDAVDLIFLPGFSTNDSVNEVSGRGVGMDVVKNNISAISGMVDVETRKGRGSRFTITLPITLAIIKSLIIRCCGRTYALPINSVLESLLVTNKDIMTVERAEVIRLREVTLPLLRLERYFDLLRREESPQEFYVVVVGLAEKRLGIVVDDLVCQQDIVIKSLGESFKRSRGISGAADLGDQSTILVLDTGGIITDTMRTGS